MLPAQQTSTNSGASTLPSESKSVPKDHIAKALDEACELHALPVVIFEAHQMLRDTRSGAQDVANLLRQDAAIASRILKLANSSYYGFQKKIGSLSQGIVVLGFQAIKNLTLTIGVLDCFRPEEEYRHEYPAFWARSLATAIASECLAHKVAGQGIDLGEHAEHAFMAGLLHDVGRLIVLQHLQTEHRQIQSRIAAGESRCSVELDCLGMDHCEIGANFLGRWKLPDSILTAVAKHHDLEPSKGSIELSEIVQLADQIVVNLGVCEPGEKLSGIRAELSQRLDYDDAKLADWIEEISIKLEQASAFFELVGYGKVDFSQQ